METTDLARTAWRKSSRSTGNGGACVETAASKRSVGVRDSKNPDGGQLRVSARQWENFTKAVRDGKL